jgi:predicted PurR-regulated permease PerM
MSLLQVDYALLGSVVAALVLLIPFVGPVVAVALPVTIALLTHPEAAVWLFFGLLALQQIIFNVLAPRILSQQIGMHPLLVFLAVLCGARVAGVWGAIFGVPIVAVVTTMVSFYRGTHEERAARLLEHLPAEDLVSVDVSSSERPEGEALISSGKGVGGS